MKLLITPGLDFELGIILKVNAYLYSSLKYLKCYLYVYLIELVFVKCCNCSAVLEFDIQI